MATGSSVTQNYSRSQTLFKGWSCGKPRGTAEKEDLHIRRTAVAHRTASAAEIRAAVGNHSDTTDYWKSVTSRTAPSQAPCSMYSTDSKPLPFVTPVVIGGRICCVF
ncbi:uncharacterized protein TNCV_4829851 [Trichonephila clavipes]|nr:uncharacterized protein TNCV_4829851 [Trichonephila clavipes]